MDARFYERLTAQLLDMESAGLLNPERILHSPQGATVKVGDRTVINLCANNYLGLANDPRVVDGAVQATRQWGAGLASVRFICGTQDIHKQLERSIADYLGYDDAILFAAAFDANGGIFEPLFSEHDAIVSDTLNHASIIDGVRLSKAKRYRYATNDMGDLERVLRHARAEGVRSILIVTDGVFSMDGTIAQIDAIAELAGRYDALTMVDDCHATGFVGPEGKGTPALLHVESRIDIISGTFGKALGGAMGGFIAAAQSVIDLLRQRARPYLFSNALTPAVCGASLMAIRIARSAEGDARRKCIQQNALLFRARMAREGFELLPGKHAIVPVMLHDAALAQAMAADLLSAGVLASGFSFPVVPKGQARIRTQMSAVLSTPQINEAADIFAEIGRKHRII